jgi:hypothetical protein
LKLTVILILLALFFGLLYYRLRPYIMMARRMFGFMRDVRGMNRNEPLAQTLNSETTADQRLVRCDACGTWIPATRAVKLRASRATYCSHGCLESAAAEGSKRKTAG